MPCLILAAQLQKYIQKLENDGYLLQRKVDRYKLRVKNIIQDTLLSKFWTSDKREKLEQATKSLENLKISPMTAAKEIMDSIDL